MTDAALTFEAQNVVRLHFNSQAAARKIAEETISNEQWQDFKKRGGIEGETSGDNLQQGDVILAQTEHPQRPGGRYFEETEWVEELKALGIDATIKHG